MNIEIGEIYMKIALLSGGSGKRLWPLSNDSFSKQYIKFINHDEEVNADMEKKCSMLQRVFGQLSAVGLGNEAIIVTSEHQKEIISSQLKEYPVELAIEPMRRDTFPAVVLASAYLYSMQNASEDEVVVVLPVDPYVTLEFFHRIIELAKLVEEKVDVIGLLGAVPTYPSEKYGYILSERKELDYYKVSGFEEKPNTDRAERLLEQGSLWNCGVFCFTIRTAKRWLEKYHLPMDYDEIVKHYIDLPKISFDYEILEHWNSIIAIPYTGIWKDIGTWNTFTEQMTEQSIGQVVMDESCENCNVINTLDIPVITMGCKDMVVATTHDGILITNKAQSSSLKNCLQKVDTISRYEERQWGTIKTIDNSKDGDVEIRTNKVKIEPGQSTSYHRHLCHDEMITILQGEGVLSKEDMSEQLYQGKTISIRRNEWHKITGNSKMYYIEVLLGDLSKDDIERKL